MYISENNCKTQGLRKAYINAITVDRYKLNKGVKELKKLDASKRLARRFTDIKYYGGSLKSFWNKVKKFGKRVWEGIKTTNRNLWKPMKWTLRTLQKPPVSTLVEKGANALGTAVGVPGMGKIVSTAIKGADSITDGIENIVKAIMDKNPQVSLQEAKNLATNVKDVVDNVGKEMGQENASKEIVNKFKEQGKRVLSKLPSLIKSEGLEKVQKAAGYLPFLDVSSFKSKERTGKGGKVLKPSYRFTKPKVITQYAKLFEKFPKYSPDVVGDVGGRLYLGGRLGNGIKEEKVEISKSKEGCGVGNKIKSKKLLEGPGGTNKIKGETKESLLEILKSRVGK